MTRRIPRVFVGLFILGQLFFLVSANLIGFAWDNRSRFIAPWGARAWSLVDSIGALDQFWAEAAGQSQAWSLFAPAIGRDCVFPAVKLCWDEKEASELVLSEHEPSDLRHYLRAGDSRMRRYETTLVITLAPDQDEDSAMTKNRWRDAIKKHVVENALVLRVYLRRRACEAMSRRPGCLQPSEVVLLFRRYHINDFASAPPFWTGPHVVPIARLAHGSTEESSLDWYDPAKDCWRSLLHE